MNAKEMIDEVAGGADPYKLVTAFIIEDLTDDSLFMKITELVNHSHMEVEELQQVKEFFTGKGKGGSTAGGTRISELLRRKTKDIAFLDADRLRRSGAKVAPVLANLNRSKEVDKIGAGISVIKHHNMLGLKIGAASWVFPKRDWLGNFGVRSFFDKLKGG